MERERWREGQRDQKQLDRNRGRYKGEKEKRREKVREREGEEGTGLFEGWEQLFMSAESVEMRQATVHCVRYTVLSNKHKD